MAFCLIFLEVGEILTAVSDEECIIACVTVVFEGYLCLCLGADDGIHRRTVGGIAEGVVGDKDISAVGGRVNPPEEDVVTHWLRPDFGATGQNAVRGGKADARTDADIVHKFRADGNFITVFKRRHTVVFKAASPDIQVDRGGCFFTRSLVGDAGIVHILEAAIFDKHILRGNPEFDRIAEADFQLVAPDTATDIFKMAVADSDISAARTCNGVDGIVTEAKPVKDDIVTDEAEVSACEVDCLNPFVDGGGVANRVKIEVVFRGGGLTPFAAKVIFLIHRVVKVALTRKVIDIITKGGDTNIAVKDNVTDTATGLCGAEPDILSLGGNPILGAAYIGAARKCGGISLTVCAVGDGGIGCAGGKLQDMVGGAALKEDGVAADKVKHFVVKGCGFGCFAVIL